MPTSISHKKLKFSLTALFILLFTVVSFSFGTSYAKKFIFAEQSPVGEQKQEEKSAVEKSVFASIFNIFYRSSSDDLSPAAAFTVDDNGDTTDAAPGNGVCLDANGKCTLRAAIQEANAIAGVDTINFNFPDPVNSIQLDPNLSSGELAINEGVTINGPGARLLTITGNASVTTADIFNIAASATTTTKISGVTIEKSGRNGINNAGKLELSDVAIKESRGAGINNTARLMVNRTLVYNNSNAGIRLTGTSTAVNISNTTVTGNSSPDNGGGINSASSDVTLNNLTINKNTAITNGGGLYYSGQTTGINVRNTIIAENTALSGPDVFANNGISFFSRGNNLIGKNAGINGFANGTNADKVGTLTAAVNPLLGPLQNNGGQTDTRALDSSSPAKNAGNICVSDLSCAQNTNPAAALNTDQRGANLPRIYENVIDMGAFETVYPQASISSLSPNNWGTGRGAFVLTVNGTDFVAGSKVKWNGVEKTTTFVSNNQLTANISASEVAASGQIPVTVVNPQPNPGQTNTLTFTVGSCAYSLNPTTMPDFPVGGGPASVALTTLGGCPWEPQSNVPWITFNSGSTSGTGSASIFFTVQPNSGALRNGTITIGDKTLTVTQRNNCTYTLSENSYSFTNTGGSNTVFLYPSDPPTCSWTVIEDIPWITVSPMNGTGLGTLTYTAQANTGAARTGTFTVGNQTFTINQAATACNYSINPTIQSFTAAASTAGTIAVTATGNCSWTATKSANASWVTITDGASGSGNGTVKFSVAANTGAARTATITVGGQIFTINQAAPCTYSISPTNRNFPRTGGTQDIAVTAANNCEWSATITTNSPWLTITSGSSGSGNGKVVISVTPNSGTQRTATLTIAGQTFTVTQDPGCTYDISPTSSQPLSAAGENSSFTLTTISGCQWTATTTDTWITFPNGPNGTDTGPVNFRVSANTGVARTGKITVGGKEFIVNQQSGCSFSLSATSSPQIPKAGVTDSKFTLTATNSGCAWTAVASHPWILVSPGSGNGTAQISYTVQPNNGAARTGTITIGSQTFTINQESGCTYFLDPTETTFTSVGGDGSFRVVTNDPSCTWTATSNHSWIRIIGNNTGTGNTNNTISFRVDANPTPERNGTITVNGQLFKIKQENGCTYTLSATSTNPTVVSAGGTRTFNINTGAGCAWSLAKDVPWITITSSTSGNSAARVDFTVDANTGPARSGKITINGITSSVTLTYNVNQDSGCSFTLSATSFPNVPAAGAPNNTVTVTRSDPRCTWTAEVNPNNSSWIVITSGADGTGPVIFEVKANTGPLRNGNLIIAGITVPVTQANGCTYTLDPTETSLDVDTSATRFFDVKVSNSACTWTAVSNNSDWITITSPASGTGPGRVTISIQASPNQVEREGKVTVEGKVFTVRQVSLTVKNFADSGLGSLRQAVINANNSPSDSVIKFADELGVGVIELRTGEIRINSTATSGKLEIRGPGADKITVSGASLSRIFYIDDANVTISGLTLSGGNGLGERSTENYREGGAVYVRVGSTTFSGVNITGNNIMGSAGQGNGGAIFYYYGTSHRIENSTISDNSSTNGGGITNLGESNEIGLTIYNSTIIRNTAAIEGGGIYAAGNTKLRNATIVNNSVTDANGTGAGLGIYSGSAMVEFGNTIIAENNGHEIYVFNGIPMSLGYNLIGNAPGDSIETGLVDLTRVYKPTDVLDKDPFISILAYFGGKTPTVALMSSSPAINAGDNSLAQSNIDQRGSARIVNNQVDIGAYEHNITITPANQTLPAGSVGTFYGQQLTTTRIPNNPLEQFKYDRIDGEVPGLIVTERGYISETPTTIGKYTLTVRATGADGMAGANKYTIQIGCSLSLSETTRTVAQGGGTFTVNITAAAGCPWNVTTSENWISLILPDVRNGNGQFTYSIPPNTGAERRGNIRIGGQTITVTQSGAANCTYTLSPSSENFSAAGGSKSFSVNTQAGCSWTAEKDAPWVTLPANSNSGSGNGTVSYSVAANSGAPRKAEVKVGGKTFTINQTAPGRTAFDFDGDGKADVAVFRPSDTSWYVFKSSDSGFSGTQFGYSTDKLAPADFDGDGKTDVSVFRDTDGWWYRYNSSTNEFVYFKWGQAGDIAVPADYDGDSKADYAVFRSGNWYISQSTNGEFRGVQFGQATDVPVPADFDGDGKTDIAVYRDGDWYWLRSSDGEFRGTHFGTAGDKPVVGDYDGDGKADQAVFRDGIWYMNGSTTGFTGIQFGIATDLPTPADYDGDGKTDVAVFREGSWYIQNSSNGQFRGIGWGHATDKPVQRAYLP